MAEPKLAFGLPQHPDEHRSKRPVLLAVDQELGEGAGLRVRAEFTDLTGLGPVVRPNRGGQPSAKRRQAVARKRVDR
jgi:hypothetical protein